MITLVFSQPARVLSISGLNGLLKIIYFHFCSNIKGSDQEDRWITKSLLLKLKLISDKKYKYFYVTFIKLHKMYIHYIPDL